MVLFPASCCWDIGMNTVCSETFPGATSTNICPPRWQTKEMIASKSSLVNQWVYSSFLWEHERGVIYRSMGDFWAPVSLEGHPSKRGRLNKIHNPRVPCQLLGSSPSVSLPWWLLLLIQCGRHVVLSMGQRVCVCVWLGWTHHKHLTSPRQKGKPTNSQVQICLGLTEKLRERLAPALG